MGIEDRGYELGKGGVELMRKLVSEELDRRCAAIDDTVVAGYGSYIGKRAEGNQAAIKVAVLDLVRSPLAMLERRLEAEPVKVVDKPAEVAV